MESNPHLCDNELLLCFLRWQLGFFTTNATWEAQYNADIDINNLKLKNDLFVSICKLGSLIYSSN